MTPPPADLGSVLDCERCSPALIMYRLNELKAGQEKQDERLASLADEVTKLREEVAGLKVKSGVWGGVAGIVPAAIAIVWSLLKGH